MSELSAMPGVRSDSRFRVEIIPEKEFEKIVQEGVNISKGELPRKSDPSILIQRVNGYEIFMGTSAVSNDRLVRKHGEIFHSDGTAALHLPHKSCLWFHSLMSTGAHVVLCWVGKEYPSPEVIRIAAGIALKNSKCTIDEVQYAALADVYQPDGAKAGVFRTFRKTTVKF